MGTEFETVYQAFYEKLEADADFFNYFHLDEYEAMELAQERAKTYLKESIARIMRSCVVGVDFGDYDEDAGCFNFDLRLDEVDMLANLMYEQEYRRQFSKLKAFKMNHVPTSLQVFSPANERKTLLAIYERIREDNVTMLDNYQSKDRESHQWAGIDYSAYTS